MPIAIAIAIVLSVLIGGYTAVVKIGDSIAKSIKTNVAMPTQQVSTPTSIPTLRPTFVPARPTKTGQVIVLEAIKKQMDEMKKEMDLLRKIMEEEGKIYCSSKYPDDLQAAISCDQNRHDKYAEAKGRYNRINQEFIVLYHQMLDIAGQK